MKLGALVLPVGILSYLLLLAAAVSGLLRVKLQNHKLLALLAVLLVTIHAILMFYLNYF